MCAHRSRCGDICARFCSSLFQIPISKTVSTNCFHRQIVPWFWLRLNILFWFDEDNQESELFVCLSFVFLDLHVDLKFEWKSVISAYLCVIIREIFMVCNWLRCGSGSRYVIITFRMMMMMMAMLWHCICITWISREDKKKNNNKLIEYAKCLIFTHKNGGKYSCATL